MFHHNHPEWPQQMTAFNPAALSPFLIRPYPPAFDINWFTAVQAATGRRFPPPIFPYSHFIAASHERSMIRQPIGSSVVNNGNSVGHSSRRSSFSVDNLLSQFNVEGSDQKLPQNTQQAKCIKICIFESDSSDPAETAISKKRCYNLYPSEGKKMSNDMDLRLPKDMSLLHAIVMDAEFCGIFCINDNGIPLRKRYGPLLRENVSTALPNEAESSTEVDHAWMNYIVSTTDENQANMTKILEIDKMYFQVSKTIQRSDQLFVFDEIEQIVATPKPANNAIKHQKFDEESHETVLPDSQSDVATSNAGNTEFSADISSDGKGFQCERCGKVFSYKYYRDKHLKYTRCVDKGDRKYPCHLCARSFEKRDRLRIHILHVHEKHRPHCCSVCGKRFSQSSSLNKHLRVHSGERPYKCVYCSKAFTASSILRTHIRQHSGEKPFKCKFCGKAFASHAAHDSHVRRTHTAPKPETHNCPLCKKSFQHSSHLKFHLQCIHGNWSLLAEREASVV